MKEITPISVAIFFFYLRSRHWMHCDLRLGPVYPLIGQHTVRANRVLEPVLDGKKVEAVERTEAEHLGLKYVEKVKLKRNS